MAKIHEPRAKLDRPHALDDDQVIPVATRVHGPGDVGIIDRLEGEADRMLAQHDDPYAPEDGARVRGRDVPEAMAPPSVVGWAGPTVIHGGPSAVIVGTLTLPTGEPDLMRDHDGPLGASRSNRRRKPFLRWAQQTENRSRSGVVYVWRWEYGERGEDRPVQRRVIAQAGHRQYGSRSEAQDAARQSQRRRDARRTATTRCRKRDGGCGRVFRPADPHRDRLCDRCVFHCDDCGERRGRAHALAPVSLQSGERTLCVPCARERYGNERGPDTVTGTLARGEGTRI